MIEFQLLSLFIGKMFLKIVSDVTNIYLILTLFLIITSAQTIPEFPSDFIFGTATSSYQIEGAYATEGRGLSVWDTFSKLPNKTLNGDNGDVACDHYSRYKDDIKRMKDLGFKAYRFSVSWSRIFPSGKNIVNPLGIQFYDNVINECIAQGLVPMITIFHWDSPQSLQDEYGGWLNRAIVDDFGAYSHLLFSRFGDRVKFWITLNEPWCYSYLGHYAAEHAPGRCSDRSKCAQGNRETEPYIVAHHLILAHAKAVKIYRDSFKHQNGTIGITLICDHKEPYSTAAADIEAANRGMEFQCAWFYDPIFFGDYPKSMKDSVGSRLPVFSDDEKLMIKGSADFFGLNHYSSRYVRQGLSENEGYDRDQGTLESIKNIDGVQIGPVASPPWLYNVPTGIGKILTWITKRYPGTVLYITENGVGEVDTGKVVLNDQHRIDYYHSYMTNVRKAMSEGAIVKGYFAWSFMDNFEWAWGYTQRFGIVHVEYKTQKRYNKKSAEWWQQLLYKHYGLSFPWWYILFTLVPIGLIALCVCSMMIGVIAVIVVYRNRERIFISQYQNLDAQYEKPSF